LFPPELVDFVPYKNNPVFTGTGTATWDRYIRERGYILRDEGIFKMWYTGYDTADNATKYLGYATSMDGFQWTRYPGNPIFDEYWTEDVMVVNHLGQYFMVAEGVNDIAHMLISSDGIHWQRAGDLDIRKVNGEPIDPGAYGTPTLWIEDDKWYLFYEREDLGIWLAMSTDQLVWTNVQDDPVIKRGPENYDAEAVALDQIVKYDGRYYTYYHASPDEDWATWNSNIAVSNDLIHWTKYEKNPILSPEGKAKDVSSPILVFDGDQYRLYSMHDGVRVFLPRKIN
jgi:sucrose-6-phosphate hydrolase SacC (GH32 family)